MNNSQILIYQNSEGNIKIDVRLEEESVWLTQAQLCELFQKSKATISEHIKNVFEEGELDEKVVVRNFRTTTQHGAMAGKTQESEVKGYNLDFLDVILQLNGRELLSHAGKISHDRALKKSNEEFKKYKELQRSIEKEQSLKEIEEDIKKLKSNI
jgi:hypothetical protein